MLGACTHTKVKVIISNYVDKSRLSRSAILGHPGTLNHELTTKSQLSGRDIIMKFINQLLAEKQKKFKEYRNLRKMTTQHFILK